MPTNLQELDRIEFDIREIFSMVQNWSEGMMFQTGGKVNHALLYFSDSAGVYRFPDGKQLEVKKGDVVSIPRGAKYRTTFFSCGDSRAETLLINFFLYDSVGTELALTDGVEIILNDDSGRVGALFQQVAEFYNRPTHSKAELKALVFRVFAALAAEQRSESMLSGRFAVIREGIRYLENDREQNCSIEELAARCGVSTNHFRRLFREYAGVSPLEFRLRNRIEQAKMLLESETMNVSEVAERLGFTDAAFFSRQFRKYVGVAPSHYGARSGSRTALGEQPVHLR